MSYYRAVPSTDAAAAQAPERIGVLLVNMGTPDAPTYFAVQRYLREFLGDRRAVDTFRLIWLPLLYGVILPWRGLRSARNYRRIWTSAGSPLAVYSRRLCAKIGALLRAQYGDGICVELGMTFGNPSIARAIQALAEKNVKRLLVLPLYPQYCASTTGSAFDRTAGVLRRWRWLPETRFVNDYHCDAGYIDALTARILEHWAQIGERSHLVFSYHGIPAAYVAEGDPYESQARATTLAVASRLSLDAHQWSHCYQLRFGSVDWLQPHAQDTLRALLARGVRKVTMVSPSFAVDCLETLQEAAMEYRDEFLHMGGERLTVVPALNDDDRHAQALAAIVAKHLQGWPAKA